VLRHALTTLISRAVLAPFHVRQRTLEVTTPDVKPGRCKRSAERSTLCAVNPEQQVPVLEAPCWWHVGSSISTSPSGAGAGRSRVRHGSNIALAVFPSSSGIPRQEHSIHMYLAGQIFSHCTCLYAPLAFPDSLLPQPSAVHLGDMCFPLDANVMAARDLKPSPPRR
jgi:hypothetical protein